MDDDGVPKAPAGAPGVEDGTGAVLYAIFTSFTEVLGGLEQRLGAIEIAVRGGPAVDAGLDARLAGIEDAVRSGRAADAGTLEAGVVAADRLGALEGAIRDLSALMRARAEEPDRTPLDDGAAADLRAQGDLLDQRTAALTAVVEELRALMQAHADDTAHSLGRRAGEAGRRLATDLGLRARPRQPKDD